MFFIVFIYCTSTVIMPAPKSNIPWAEIFFRLHPEILLDFFKKLRYNGQNTWIPRKRNGGTDMKRTSNPGGWLLGLLVSMLLNLLWTIPAWVLLGMHFWLGWSILWFWIALGAWLGITVLWMVVLSWAGKCSSQPDQLKENKNPYSAKHFSGEQG
jgi:hypothetical protein